MPAKRGRPAYQPTTRIRREVEEMLAARMPGKDIAAVLGINEDTFHKHFAEEVRIGAAKRRGEVVKMLFKAGRGGNVAAQKKLLELTTPPDAAPAPRVEPPGKKEQAAGAATTAGAGTEWGNDLTFETPARAN
jgi:hypothetical protein